MRPPSSANNPTSSQELRPTSLSHSGVRNAPLSCERLVFAVSAVTRVHAGMSLTYGTDGFLS